MAIDELSLPFVLCYETFHLKYIVGMTSLNIMGRKFILERTKRNDNIEEIYTSAYVSLPSSTDTRLPHFKAKEEDCDVYEEGTNLVGKNAKYTYRSLVDI